MRGHLDRLDDALHGWVVDPARPTQPLPLELLVDGAVVARGVAGQPRPDVAAAGLGGPDCGFALPLPAPCRDGAEHDLALRQPGGPAFHLPGLPPRLALGPVRFTLEAPAPGLAGAALDLLRLTQAESGLDPDLIQPDGVARWLASPAAGHLLALARANGRLVGYAAVGRQALPQGRAGLLRLSVIAAYRRKGIGLALLEEVLRQARALGDDALWLAVAAENRPAQALYERLGFRWMPAAPRPDWAAPGERVACKDL